MKLTVWEFFSSGKKYNWTISALVSIHPLSGSTRQKTLWCHQTWRAGRWTMNTSDFPRKKKLKHLNSVRGVFSHVWWHWRVTYFLYGGVLKWGNYPKSSILMGFSIMRQPLGDTPILGTPHISPAWPTPAAWEISDWRPSQGQRLHLSAPGVVRTGTRVHCAPEKCRCSNQWRNI